MEISAMDKIQRQFTDLDPNESADELWAFTVQCHFIGFIAGVVVTALVFWIAF